MIRGPPGATERGHRERQAQLEGLVSITADPAIGRSEVETIW